MGSERLGLAPPAPLSVAASLQATLRRARARRRSTEESAPRRIDVLGDDEFRQIYEEHARPVWAYVYRVSRDPSLADDVLQEVFCRYLEAPSSRRDASGLRSYLYRIASNLVVDRVRRAAREVAAYEGAAESMVEAPDGLGHDVAALFSELPPRQRALLWLAYVEEMSHAEIARVLSVSRASVRVLLFRARRRMARILEREGLDEGSLR